MVSEERDPSVWEEYIILEDTDDDERSSFYKKVISNILIDNMFEIC